MPSILGYAYFLLHPQELRNIIQWVVWHNPVHERDESKESPSLKTCFKFLDQTSRSFSAVIKELNHELLVPICLFYLVLRGLDTVEDDMTIPIDKKEPVLRNFHNTLQQEGWTFQGNGSREKDRELLVQFDNVITEFAKIKPEYREIILDITKRMGNGMADYQVNGMVDYEKEKQGGTEGLITVDDYEVYCHHVAGLVGEGLTRLFVGSGLANPALLKRPDLHESMGQFLQQTNIIRDVREDFEDGRRFWPKAVWSKYVSKFDDLFQPENRDAALKCNAEMILLALDRADDCLFYMAGIRDQSVFNFVAIPQAMAIATMELCFRNPKIFEKNVKITKGQACRLMLDSSQNLQLLYETFKTYARKIHKKNDPRDPNFLKVSIACGRIEQFIESIFPSQAPDAIASNDAIAKNTGTLSAEDTQRAKERAAEQKEDIFWMGLAVVTVVVMMAAFMLFIAWMVGARFDLMFKDMSSAFGKGGKSAVHSEL